MFLLGNSLLDLSVFHLVAGYPRKLHDDPERPLLCRLVGENYGVFEASPCSDGVGYFKGFGTKVGIKGLLNIDTIVKRNNINSWIVIIGASPLFLRCFPEKVLNLESLIVNAYVLVVGVEQFIIKIVDLYRYVATLGEGSAIRF